MRVTILFFGAREATTARLKSGQTPINVRFFSGICFLSNARERFHDHQLRVHDHQLRTYDQIVRSRKNIVPTQDFSGLLEFRTATKLFV